MLSCTLHIFNLHGLYVQHYRTMYKNLPTGIANWDCEFSHILLHIPILDPWMQHIEHMV